MSNTITAYFKGRIGVAEAVYQNDYGIVMVFDGIDLPAHFDCYFSVPGSDTAMPGIGAYNGEDNRVVIPNSVLSNSGNMSVHIPLHTGVNDSEVEYIVYFKVIGRARPEDDGTPAQMTAIEQALALLQNPIDNIEQIVNEALSFTGDTFDEMQNKLDIWKGGVESDFDNLDAQFQTAVSALTVDSEVQNIRVGDDNVTYTSAGEAVRKQFSGVKSANALQMLEKIPFESGFYNDNGARQAYLRRLRSKCKVLLDSFAEIDIPTGYKGYALVYDESGTKLGFYGYNSGNFTTAFYKSFIKASFSSAYSIGINVAKDDMPTSDISAYADYVSENTKLIPNTSIKALNYAVTNQSTADALMNNDVDNLPLQSIAYIASSLSIAHLPTPTFNGSILTYAPSILNNVSAVQFAIEKNASANTYKRIKNNDGWTAWSKLVNDNNVHLLTYGNQIASGTDLLSLTTVGTYYCPNRTVAASLTNCPTTKAFKMTIEYSTGNDPTWLLYKLTDTSGGVFVNAMQNNVQIGWTSEAAPGLSTAQKIMLRDLFLDYIDNRDTFYYEYNVMRDAYADGANIYTDKADVVELFPNAESVSTDGFFKINCSSFIEMIMMGRDVSDFVGKNAETYSSDITPYVHPTYGTFDFGYYFDFIDRSKCYHKGIKDEHGNLIGLYSYNDKTKEPYSANTRYSDGNTTGLIIDGEPLNQSWLLYETASDMALELYRKGCEIRFSELQVGDLVFTKTFYPYEDSFSATAFRNIGHVAMVIGFNSDGLPNFGESGWMFPTLIRSGYNYEADGDVLHVQMLIKNTVMCARHPVAFGISANVPSSIEEVE